MKVKSVELQYHKVEWSKKGVRLYVLIYLDTEEKDQNRKNSIRRMIDLTDWQIETLQADDKEKMIFTPVSVD